MPAASLTAATPAAPKEAGSTTFAQLSALEGHVQLTAGTREQIQSVIDACIVLSIGAARPCLRRLLCSAQRRTLDAGAVPGSA